MTAAQCAARLRLPKLRAPVCPHLARAEVGSTGQRGRREAGAVGFRCEERPDTMTDLHCEVLVVGAGNAAYSAALAAREAGAEVLMLEARAGGGGPAATPVSPPEPCGSPTTASPRCAR